MSVVLSSDGFHIESHIDSVPALARVKDLHGGLSSGQQALGRIVQSLLADADALDGIQLYALSGAIESGLTPGKWTRRGVSYAALVSVADASASKSSGARRLHHECRRRVL